MNTNQQMVNKVFGELENFLEDYKAFGVPNALDEIGRNIVEHSKLTHEYQNRSGKLEQSHDYLVVESGKTEEFKVFRSNGDSFSIPITAQRNEVKLIIGTHQQYGFWVEVKNGFSVLINSFLKMKRDFTKMFGAAIKQQRL